MTVQIFDITKVGMPEVIEVAVAAYANGIMHQAFVRCDEPSHFAPVSMESLTKLAMLIGEKTATLIIDTMIESFRTIALNKGIDAGRISNVVDELAERRGTHA